MTLLEKAAYIKGLADGMELDTSSKEGKLISALIDLVSEAAQEISELSEQVETVHAYCEELDEDLGSVEELLLESDDEDDDLFDDEDDWESEDDGEFYEVECPACGETICFDESLDPEELACPACGERFECSLSAEELAPLDD